MEKKIILNRIKTPDGTILTSNHVHDYQTHIDKNGLEYMVDGGGEYLRRTVHEDHPYTEMSVYDDDPFEIIREALCWGTYGKDGNQPLEWKPLSKMSNEHINSVINTQKHLSTYLKDFMVYELEYRTVENIIISD